MQGVGRGNVALAAGVMVGLGLAMAGLVDEPLPIVGLPPGAAAVVNGHVIAADDLERAVAALDADRRTPVDEAERRRLLDRLIEEELLLQHAIDLDLVRRDPRVRGQLVAGVIEAVVAESEATEPTEEALRAFYDANHGYFMRPGRLRVRRHRVPGGDGEARARAERLTAALRAGKTPGAADETAVPIPDALLPLAKLQQYLGPTLTAAAARLEPGIASQPIAHAGAWHVLEVIEREPDVTPPFDEVRAAVREEARRRHGEEALRRYLDDLRRRALVLTRASP
jgi:parvulin-like peptidyl-prolyl isomerase